MVLENEEKPFFLDELWVFMPIDKRDLKHFVTSVIKWNTAFRFNGSLFRKKKHFLQRVKAIKDLIVEDLKNIKL